MLIFYDKAFALLETSFFIRKGLFLFPLLAEKTVKK